LLVTAVLAQVVLYKKTLFAAFFRSVLRYFGAISYSLYLWQQLFIVTRVPSWGGLRDLPMSVIVPILIAATSYHIIAKPILRLKGRLAPQA
jgi:peptidoglycan/LPS O-acetylase OafA/YrhL